MNLLITRPYEDSLELAKKLAHKKINVIIDPLIIIESLDEVVKNLDQNKLSQYDLLIFTSKNALKIFALNSNCRNNQIIVIGIESYYLAKNLGFNNIKTANGTAISMLETIMSMNKINKILYLSGNVITQDLTHELKNKGYDAERLIIYKTFYAKRFSNQVSKLLFERKIDAVMLYSVKSAETFINNLKKLSFDYDLCSVKLFTLSKKIANIVSNVKCHRIYIAKKPNQEEIIKLVEQYSNG